MLFRLKNGPKDRQTHCGVLEFCAEEGRVYVPRWVSCANKRHFKNIIDAAWYSNMNVHVHVVETILKI